MPDCAPSWNAMAALASAQVAALDEGDGGVRHVAHPRDVPLTGRDAGEDLALSAARLLHLAHTQDDLRLGGERRLGRACAAGGSGDPRVPGGDLVGEELVGSAAVDPRADRVDDAGGVAVEREPRDPAGPGARARGERAERGLEAGDRVGRRATRARVVHEVRARVEQAERVVGRASVVARGQQARVGHGRPGRAPLVVGVARGVVRDLLGVGAGGRAAGAEVVVEDGVDVDRPRAAGLRDLHEHEARDLREAHGREVVLVDGEARHGALRVHDARAGHVLDEGGLLGVEPRAGGADAHARIAVEEEVARLRGRRSRAVRVLEELHELELLAIPRDGGEPVGRGQPLLAQVRRDRGRRERRPGQAGAERSDTSADCRDCRAPPHAGSRSRRERSRGLRARARP